MNQTHNAGVMKAIGIFMLLVALVNVVPGLVFIGTGAAQEIAEDDTLVEGDAPAEAAETAGSFTSPMGILTIVLAPVLTVVGIGLLLGKRWEIFAALVLIFDLFVKIGVTLSLFATGRTGGVLVPVAIIVIELIAIVVSWQQWSAHKVVRAPDAEHIERPQYR